MTTTTQTTTDMTLSTSQPLAKVTMPSAVPVLPDTSHETIQLYVMERIERDGPVLYSEGRWWQFGPLGAWVPMPEQAIWAEVRAINGLDTLEAATEDRTGRTIKVTAGLVESVVKLAQSRYHEDDAFRSATRGVVTPKGLWHIDATGALKTRVPMPQDRIRLFVPVDPTQAPAKLWEATLRRMWGHEEDYDARCRFLHEWLGAVLMGDVTKRQVAPILVGDGENGKSVVVEVITGLFPEELRCTVTPQDLETNRFAAARLVGAALNHASEIPSSELMTSAKIKAVIDGSEQSAERKGRDAFDFRPIAGHLFSANALPPVRDLSHGFWRRFAPLTCTAPKITASEKRRDLAETIIATERGAILGWALRAYALMAREQRGYCEVASVGTAVHQWRAESDTVQVWVDEECQPGGLTAVRVLYAAYKTYTMEAGGRPVGLRVFGHRLAQLGYPAARTMTDRSRGLTVGRGFPA